MFSAYVNGIDELLDSPVGIDHHEPVQIQRHHDRDNHNTSDDATLAHNQAEKTTGQDVGVKHVGSVADLFKDITTCPPGSDSRGTQQAQQDADMGALSLLVDPHKQVNDNNSPKHSQAMVPVSAQPVDVQLTANDSAESVDALVPVAESYPSPVVQNIIASVNLGQELNLRTIAVSARNAEYNPKKVNAVIMRLRDPKCTGLLYRCGRMMVTGARGEENARQGAKRMARICQKAGHPDIQFIGFKIENMIATANCKFAVRLEGLAYNHREYCSYEPELSPGLVYRYNPQDNKIVLLFFVSGKVIITGCKSREEIEAVFQNVYPVLYRYRK